MFGRLAQLVEQLFYTEKVGGSSPSAPTMNIEAFIDPFFTRHPFFFVGLMLLSLIAIILKGYALWYAAQHHEKNWFIALLLINSLGLLEIFYLYKRGQLGGSEKRS